VTPCPVVAFWLAIGCGDTEAGVESRRSNAGVAGVHDATVHLGGVVGAPSGLDRYSGAGVAGWGGGERLDHCPLVHPVNCGHDPWRSLELAECVIPLQASSRNRFVVRTVAPPSTLNKSCVP
jgi:hypothetical protein